MFPFVSVAIDTPCSTPWHSLAKNQLCYLHTFGEGTYSAEGITKLCEGLKGSAVTSLKCAAAPKRCLLFVSAPIDTPPSVGSLAFNLLCGLDSEVGGGTYTTEGITKLCEGLKGSSVTSLECAATPKSVCFCVSAP